MCWCFALLSLYMRCAMQSEVQYPLSNQCSRCYECPVCGTAVTPTTVTPRCVCAAVTAAVISDVTPGVALAVTSAVASANTPWLILCTVNACTYALNVHVSESLMFAITSRSLRQLLTHIHHIICMYTTWLLCNLTLSHFIHFSSVHVIMLYVLQ
jgi:hypothetical protein